MEAEQLVKRHSGPEGILRRRSAAVDDLPRRRSVADCLLRLAGPETPPEAPARPVELVLARRGMRTASSDSDSSDASFHTAQQSPMCEASPLVPRVTITAEPARARQQPPLIELGTRQEAKSESDSKRQPKLELERERDSQSETKEVREHESRRKREPDSPSAPDSSRERADSWRLSAGRKATVSVRTRIGQFERELGVLTRRPGGAGREPAAAEPTSRWYSNQNEDDHVYFFKEGSTSSTWTLPAAENGASQTAKDAESVHLRQPPVGGVPSVLQVARGQRGRSLVFPPPPSTEPPPSQLISGNQTHVILNQGTLNHTKLAKETSWRARKSWAPCRVVLTDRSLFLFKDTRGNAGMPPQWSRAGHRPETTVDLAGAFADWDSEASSRKNVFQIRTVRGLRLLLQDDDALTAGHWFDAIKRAIADVPPSSYRLLPVARQMTDDRLTRSRSVRFTAGPDSQEDLSRDSSTIRDRLRRFFRARPPADSLVSRGILKDEPVFGGHLAALCAIEGSTVPRFVIECISAIETKPEHMKMDGVYRASGNLSQVQRIRCEVDQDNYQVLYDEEDVHVLTGALKLFFRELKEPLIPFAVLPEALRVAGLTDRADQVTGFQRLVAGLPPPNRDTLGALLGHLDRVTELQEFNRMHAHNLAIVFGPTLMWPEHDSPDLALDLMRQNRVVEALLELKTEVLESP